MPVAACSVSTKEWNWNLKELFDLPAIQQKNNMPKKTVNSWRIATLLSLPLVEQVASWRSEGQGCVVVIFELALLRIHETSLFIIFIPWMELIPLQS